VRYIVDVTQLVHWPGNLTGIPRVMDELAIRFQKFNPDNTVFVSWVKELEEMCEVDFARTRPHRGKGIDYIYKDVSLVAPGSHAIKVSGPKSVIKKIIRKVAVKFRLDNTKVYKKAVGISRSIGLRQLKIYAPKKTDKFFIPWGEWWDQDWLDKIKSYTYEGVEIFPVCHDILPMVVPQFSGNSGSLKDFVSQIFPVSKTVVVQSRSTQEDLTMWMQGQELEVPDIQQFRLGEDFSTTHIKPSDSEMLEKYKVKKDGYLVYVSTIEPRKNHTLLYYTYKLAKSRGVHLPKLLIIGRVGHDTTEIIKFIKEDPQINQQIKICDQVSDDELNWLYENCMFTIVPSFYEGWGMSVLESIFRGKSAVCSNTSSLAEMPDNCVIRFNPASTDECLDAIIVMSKPATLKRYRENASQYRPHSWDASYKQVIDILGE
jgi:glycosyltransferase involved in cell wall biosynthesis